MIFSLKSTFLTIAIVLIAAASKANVPHNPILSHRQSEKSELLHNATLMLPELADSTAPQFRLC